jgi:hypothetical protein
MYALKMLQSGQAGDQVLALMQRERLDRLDGPLGDVYAQTLVTLNRQNELLAEAGGLELQALLSIPPETAAGVCSVIAAVFEGRDFVENALHFFDLAEHLAANIDDRRAVLSVLIGGIRIRRKLQIDLGRRRDSVELAGRFLVVLGSGIYEQRVLARETAAELGEVVVEDGPESDETRAIRRLLQVVSRPTRPSQVPLSVVIACAPTGSALVSAETSDPRDSSTMSAKSCFMAVARIA